MKASFLRVDRRLELLVDHRLYVVSLLVGRADFETSFVNQRSNRQERSTTRSCQAQLQLLKRASNINLDQRTTAQPQVDDGRRPDSGTWDEGGKKQR